jgi:hypothetical protein
MHVLCGNNIFIDNVYHLKFMLCEGIFQSFFQTSAICFQSSTGFFPSKEIGIQCFGVYTLSGLKFIWRICLLNSVSYIVKLIYCSAVLYGFSILYCHADSLFCCWRIGYLYGFSILHCQVDTLFCYWRILHLYGLTLSYLFIVQLLKNTSSYGLSILHCQVDALFCWSFNSVTHALICYAYGLCGYLLQFR